MKMISTGLRAALVGLMSVSAMVSASSDARADGPDLAAKCRETGEHGPCAVAGAAAEAASPETTVELYVASCAKHPDQCWALIAYAQRTMRKRDPARAGQLLEKGCDLKSARSCMLLAAELEEGERGILPDASKAAKFYDRACELGASRACVLLAVMIDDGRGARRDAARAQRVRARAEALDKAATRPAVTPAEAAADEAQCRKKQDAQRCLAAGVALQDTDAVKAEEVFRICCTADKASCGLWGFAVERFRRDDSARGLRVLEEGCAQGTSLACEVLADLNHAGPKSITRNEARAAELYDKACSLGEPAGCRAVASRFRGARQTPKADELRDRAFSLEAEADKGLPELQAKWLKEAPQREARDVYFKELDRRRAEWRALEQRSRTRWELRMQRLAAVDAGNAPASLPPAPATDAEASAARDAAIKRMAKALFP